MASKTTIELNGRHYDVTSGKPIGGHKTAHHPMPKSGSLKGGGSVDGIISPSPQQQTLSSRHQHHRAANAPKHSIQKAKTLTRTAVKLPEVKRTERSLLEMLANDTPSATLSFNGHVDKSRALRASHVNKSRLISRFTSAQPNSVNKKTAHLPVVEEKPLPIQDEPPTEPDYIPHSSHKLDAFELAMKHAKSHEQKSLAKPKKTGPLSRKLGMSRQATGLASAVIAALALVSFFAYQNIPNLQVRLAATRAGVGGSLPSYKPSGFSVGSVHPSPGQIVINFRSNTDGRYFQITQSKSSWNSEALLANFVVVKNLPYQTYQEQGKTIYIYNDSQATWVDGGIWYRIEGEAQLTSDQVLRIAKSL